LNLESDYTKEKLIEGLTHGDNEVLRFIYKENFKIIRYLVTSNSGSVSDAKDIFQETMVILYRKIRENNQNITSSLNTFIYAIARLLWLKELDIRNKKSEIYDTEDNYISNTANIIELIERDERLRLYREKFENLSEDCKKVIRMFLNKVSVKDITHIMGYSTEQHTKNRHYKCKKTLISKIKRSSKFNELGYENN
jgi:RNA polymerase sigma factor (sigma-70 family)